MAQKADSLRNVNLNPPGSQRIDIKIQAISDRSYLSIKQDDRGPLLKDSSVFVSGQEMRIKNQTVANFLQIYKRGERFDVIAYVKLRDYLKGVVSAEIPLNWPIETIKAQIVAARSYSLYMAEQRKKHIFDLEASIKDQAYSHTEDSALDPLMDATANMILLDKENKLFKTYYHSECGGRTSSAKKVFGDRNFDVEVNDPYCRGRSWQLKISKSEIEKFFGPFKEILSTFNPLKRAYAVSLRRVDQSIESIDAQKMRLNIGSTRLKSTWFEMHQEGSSIEFKGKGYGHGVGLCQWGSRQMGLLKKPFTEILSFYYPNSFLKNVKSHSLYL